MSLHPDSHVLTANHGAVPIANIHRSTNVQTEKNRVKKVKEKVEKEYAGPVYTLHYIGGKITVTPDQVIGGVSDNVFERFFANGNPRVVWRRADTLNQGDFVWAYSEKEERYSTIMIQNIDVWHYSGPVYDLDIETDSGYVAEGILVRGA